MKNVFDYSSQMYIFNPFMRKKRKVVNSPEQFHTEQRVLQMDSSLKRLVCRTGGYGEPSAHLLIRGSCITLTFPSHKLTRSARGKPGAEAQLRLQFHIFQQCQLWWNCVMGNL